MENKKEIKKTNQGIYFIEIPSNFIRITKLKQGDTIEFMLGTSVTPKKDDLIIRRTP